MIDQPLRPHELWRYISTALFIVFGSLTVLTMFMQPVNFGLLVIACLLATLGWAGLMIACIEIGYLEREQDESRARDWQQLVDEHNERAEFERLVSEIYGHQLSNQAGEG